jgi:hypothetical protein
MTRTVALLIALSAAACEGRIEDPNNDTGDDSALPVDSRAYQRGRRRCDAARVDGVGLRRLTRSQYHHAVDDAFGVDVGSPEQAFAADAKAGPFDTNGGTAVSEELVDAYLNAAEDIAPILIAERDAFFSCDLAATGARGCAERFVDTVGRRLYRRPPAGATRDRLLALFDAERAREGYDAGLELVLQAMLQSPHFLYRVELGQPGGDAGAVDAYGVASRLSFLLWDSIPDDALLDAAASGALLDPDRIEVELERMLADPRAERGVAAFFLQWLDVRAAEDLAKDPEAFPLYDEALAQLMTEETRRFTDSVMREGDGSLVTLLTSTSSFASGPLHEVYGLPAPADSEWHAVAFDGRDRAGILTHASFLARTSHPNQTTPVLRGKAIRESFLCTSLPEPPPDIDTTPPDLDPDLTTRERFSQHATDPVCAGCHGLMDPIGLGFEGYDALGQRRAVEAGKPVDESGDVFASWDADGAFTGVPELAERLAGSLQVHECMVDQWFAYTYGRTPTDADFCALVELDDAFQGAGLRFPDLLTALVQSEAFRHGAAQE